MGQREDILATKMPGRTVHVPGWQEPVRIRGLSGRDFNSSRLAELMEAHGEIAALVVASCIDDKGKPLFSDADCAAVSDLPAYQLKELAQCIKALNGVGDAGLEDAAKNSESSPGDSSS